jgi:superoxide reductase
MSTKLNQIYKCSVCGNIVEVVHQAQGELVCCGKPMALLEANTVDAAVEKHLPVVETDERGLIVKVGSQPHPMTPEHHIEWIEVIDGSYVERFNLKPGVSPQVLFERSAKRGLVVRAYCNLHGLWEK